MNLEIAERSYLTTSQFWLPSLRPFVLMCRKLVDGKQIVPDTTTNRLLAEFFGGKGELFDLMMEGDDGQHFFSTMLMNLLGRSREGRPNKKSFAEEFYGACTKNWG